MAKASQLVRKASEPEKVDEYVGRLKHAQLECADVLLRRANEANKSERVQKIYRSL